MIINHLYNVYVDVMCTCQCDIASIPRNCTDPLSAQLSPYCDVVSWLRHWGYGVVFLLSQTTGMIITSSNICHHPFKSILLLRAVWLYQLWSMVWSDFSLSPLAALSLLVFNAYAHDHPLGALIITIYAGRCDTGTGAHVYHMLQCSCIHSFFFYDYLKH